MDQETTSKITTLAQKAPVGQAPMHDKEFWAIATAQDSVLPALRLYDEVRSAAHHKRSNADLRSQGLDMPHWDL